MGAVYLQPLTVSTCCFTSYSTLFLLMIHVALLFSWLRTLVEHHHVTPPAEKVYENAAWMYGDLV